MQVSFKIWEVHFMMNKRICIVTGARAEYGLLARVMALVEKDPRFVLQIIATGMHLVR